MHFNLYVEYIFQLHKSQGWAQPKHFPHKVNHVGSPVHPVDMFFGQVKPEGVKKEGVGET